MSAIEETKPEVRVATTRPAAKTAGVSIVTRVLNLLSSVRFGVSLLVVLAVACMIGMLIVQQNVDGFDKYFAALTPAQKFLYGKLGFFDIYNAWYFNGIVLVLALNLVLASIDRFPSAWTYISRKKLDASAHWLRGQEQSANVALHAPSRAAAVEQVSNAFRASRMRPVVTEKGDKTFIFGERGAWNRLGAYAVHVALLTIFFGRFLTAMFSVGGNMPLEPGTTSSQLRETIFNVDQLSPAFHNLPFEVECTDVEQKLIRKEGRITSDNTLDWLTRIRIKDPARPDAVEALVHLNKPYDYGGFRFFQASFIPNGKARQIVLRVTPQAGGEPQDLTIPRDGTATLADGTRVEFRDFAANFTVGGAQQDSGEGEYNLPAATLAVTKPGASAVKAIAFTPEMAERAPFAKQPVAGYTWRLVDFEKAPQAHVLAVQYDPGANTVYVGFALLGLTLSAVFFFSHDRIWALVEEKEEGRFEIVTGGNTNRNHLGFGDRFKKLVAGIGGEPFEVKKS